MSERYGTLERRGELAVLTFTRRLPHRPERVWRALTEDDQLARWFPTTIEGPRAAGAPLRFGQRDGAGPPFDGELVAFDPPRLLELRWGEDLLRFELAPDGDGTLLTLTDAFGEPGRAARDGAGWHVCLDALAGLLDAQPPADSGERWRAVHPGYVERFGPAASTIGPPPGWQEAHPAA